MKNHNQIVQLITLAALWILNAQISTAFAQGTAFTYQGQLNSAGGPANGNYDFRFKLYEDPFGNTQIGASQLINAVGVTNGLFIATLDFGSGIFTGINYWLEVDVRTSGAGSYTDLSPLQAVTPTPYAIMAESTSNLSGTLPASQLSGTISNVNLPANPVFSGTVSAGAFSGNGFGLTNLNGNALQLPSDVALLDASQTFSAAQTTFGDISLGNSSAHYHHLSLSGGNSVGYLYGSYPAFGDGIHFGYNFYANTGGTNVIPNSGGGTSRISAGYGSIGLYVGGTAQPPSSGMTIFGGNVTVTGNGIGFNSSSPLAALDLGPSAGWCGGNVIYRNGNNNLWLAGIDCNGNFGFSISLATVGAGGYNAYIDPSGNYHQSSDLRLKRDITSIDSTLDRVLKLRPVSYRFRSAGPDAPLTLGFLAQEVEPLFPEVVGEQSNGDKDLVYSELIPVAIRSIQELNQKVEAKDAEIADLKARLEKLERLLSPPSGAGKSR